MPCGRPQLILWTIVLTAVQDSVATTTTTTTTWTRPHLMSTEDDIETELVIGIVSAIAILVLTFAGIFLYYQRRKWKRKRKMLQMDELGWYVLDYGRPVGPYDNYQMSMLFQNGQLDRESCVRLNWQARYTPIGMIFPEGQEFIISPVFSQEDNDAPWHRHTVAGSLMSETWWYYLTEDGALYGPFESGKMRQWYLYGFFDEALLVREGDQDGDFQPIGDLFPDKDYAFIPDVKEMDEQPQMRPRTSYGEQLRYNRLEECAESSHSDSKDLTPTADTEAQVIGKCIASAGTEGDGDDLRRHESAVKIQSIYRGNKVRKSMNVEKKVRISTFVESQPVPRAPAGGLSLMESAPVGSAVSPTDTTSGNDEYGMKASKSSPQKPSKPKRMSAPAAKGARSKSKMLAPPGLQQASLSDTEPLRSSSKSGGKHVSPKAKTKGKASRLQENTSSESGASVSKASVKSTPA